MSVADDGPDAILTAAHAYARRGWRVIALHAPTQSGACSCMRAGCTSVGKHPVESGWQNTPPMSGADIQATFEEGTRNVGIATGDPSGFWVLDIDLDKPGTKERVLAMQEGRTFPPTYIVKTGGGGYQYYFAMPDFQVTNSAKRLPDGVDVRGTGGQVVAPPSVSGKGPYRVVSDKEILPAPEWLLDLVRPLPPAAPVDLETLPKLTDLPPAEQTRLATYTEKTVARLIERLATCRVGGWGTNWNATTFEVACSLIELANSPWCPLTLQEARTILLAEAPSDSNFGEAEITERFNSALRTTDGKGRALPVDRTPQVIAGDPLSDPSVRLAPPSGGGDQATPPAVIQRAWNDLGNARRMVDLYGDHLRWVGEAEDWAVYKAGRWDVAGHPAGRAMAQDMVEGLVEREGHLYDSAPGGEDGDQPSELDRFKKWAHGQQMSSKITAALKECTGRKELQASMMDFDSRPLGDTPGEMLFNVANGVIDLTTGELHPHDPELLMMMQSPVSYDADAPCPKWEKFLERTQPDPEMRDYLQMVFGYSLTASMAEQALFIHHGSGANGKSVFLVVAARLAGLYSQVVPRETLLARAGTGTEHPTSVARMRGKRFLQASETAAGRRLDEETVKGLTGGEEQTARFMGANFFDFTPTGKIHLITNHLPRLTDAESIWRRLHVIKWGQTIPVEERDPRMLQPAYWADEEAGILAWAVRGAVRWHHERLSVPAAMRADLNEYRSDQDVLGEFIAGRLEADPHAYTATSDIYGAYSAWCFNSGIRSPLTAQDLGRVLAERKFEKKRTGKSRGFAARLLPADVSARDPLNS